MKDIVKLTLTSTSNIKAEKKDPSSVKMESNFQSPESPPMHHESNHEQKPIMIPTERRDGDNYCYDSLPVTSRDTRRSDSYRRDRHDDHRRNEREYKYHRESRSRSRSRSPSYDRRYDKKRSRHSRSNSRDRDRDRRRSRSRDRKYHRNSPSYGRSKSPYFHHQRDNRRFDRWDRNYDNKAGIKSEIDSKFQLQQNLFNQRDIHDEPSTSTSTSTRYPNPVNRFNRQIKNIKHEQNDVKPTFNRFGVLDPNKVEQVDLRGK